MSDADDDDATDAEDLISHLCGGLAPADCATFRRAAKNALASSPQCRGPGSVYRTLVPLWREYFRPPPDNLNRTTTWSQGRRASKLVSEPSIAPRRSRRLKLVM